MTGLSDVLGAQSTLIALATAVLVLFARLLFKFFQARASINGLVCLLRNASCKRMLIESEAPTTQSLPLGKSHVNGKSHGDIAFEHPSSRSPHQFAPDIQFAWCLLPRHMAIRLANLCHIGWRNRAAGIGADRAAQTRSYRSRCLARDRSQFPLVSFRTRA